MSILFHDKGQIVQLSNDTISYVMEVVDGKYLVHRYFGRKIRNYRGTGNPLYFKRGYNTEHDSSIENISFDDFPFEYPVGGHGDFRIPAFAITQEDGITFCEPMFKSWSVVSGKPKLQGAVNVYGEDYMAGFSAAAKIQNVICTVFVAFGATIATYVGQNWGAGKVDRVRQGVRCTQIMILAYSVIAMILVFFFSKYLTYLFISPSETKVIEVSVLYFHTVFWCYPFLGSIFLYRNTLQGLGYGLVPMLGGVFELAARSAIVVLVAGKTSFAGVCLSDPAAWISALIPLIPYYVYVTRKWKKQGKIAV